MPCAAWMLPQNAESVEGGDHQVTPFLRWADGRIRATSFAQANSFVSGPRERMRTSFVAREMVV